MADQSSTQLETKEPQPYQEALCMKDSAEHQRAMDAHIERIKHTYEVVPLTSVPITANIIGGRWVFDDSHGKRHDLAGGDKATYTTHNDHAHPSRASPFRGVTLRTSTFKHMEKRVTDEGWHRGRISANSEYGRYCTQPEGYGAGITG